MSEIQFDESNHVKYPKDSNALICTLAVRCSDLPQCQFVGTHAMRSPSVWNHHSSHCFFVKVQILETPVPILLVVNNVRKIVNNRKARKYELHVLNVF